MLEQRWTDMRAHLVAMMIASTALVAVPIVASDHCESRLTVYSRPSFAPAPLPPYHQLDANACTTSQGLGVDGHVFLPNADQIMVRVNGAFGPSITTLPLDLDGMGFHDAGFTLHRVAEPGGATFQLSEWLFIPDAEDGELTATVHYPRESFSVTYRASPVQLPLPALPPPPAP